MQLLKRHTAIALALLLLARVPYCGAGEASAQDVPVPPAEELQKLIQSCADYYALPPNERLKAKKPACDYPPLTKAAAEQWRKALWQAWVERRRQVRQDEAKDNPQITTDPVATGHSAVKANFYPAPGVTDKATMLYTVKAFGTKPATGWPLYINIHGGGNSKAVNDTSWNAAKGQYHFQTGLYVCPRSVVDEPESWYAPVNYPLFEKLLAEVYALWDVDPNRICIMGYSMGGWGTLHLGPSIPDYWAAVAASAGAGFVGATGRSAPDNLRNTPTMIQIGSNDNEFGRFPRSKAFAAALRAMHEKDPDGYIVEYKEHAGAGHAINDKDTPGWLAKFTRAPLPKKIVWQQLVPTPGNSRLDVEKLMTANLGFSLYFRRRCYWLRNDSPGGFQRVVASREGNTIRIEQAKQLEHITILLDDRMADLDQPVRVLAGDQELASAVVPRSAATLLSTLVERGDPELTFCAEIAVAPPDSAAALEGKELTTVEQFSERAQYRLAQNKLDDAAADIEAALKLDPKQGPGGLFASLLQIAGIKKDAAKRVDVYRRWAEAVPEDANLLNSCAWECLTTAEEFRDVKTALTHAQKAVELSARKNPAMLDTLALALFRNGKIDEALEAQRQAIALLPANLPAAMRAEYDTRLKEFEAAATAKKAEDK